MLQKTGFAILNQLSVLDDIIPLGTKITKLIGHTMPSGRKVLNIDLNRTSPDLYSLGIQRSSLFNTLFETANAEKIDFEFGANIAHACPKSGYLQYQNNYKSPSFDIIIDAMGARSCLSSFPKNHLKFGALWTTLDWPADTHFKPDALNQRYKNASQMIGIMPSGQTSLNSPKKATFFWSMKESDYQFFLTNPIDLWKSDVLSLWPECEDLLRAISSHENLTFAQYRHRTHNHPTHGRIVHVGDSWHATSPQLGQGANNALLDAYAIALALSRTKEINYAIEDYLIMRQPHVHTFQAMSRWLTPLYQSDARFTSWIRDWIAAPLATIPPGPDIQAAMLTGAIMSPLKRLGL